MKVTSFLILFVFKYSQVLNPMKRERETEKVPQIKTFPYTLTTQHHA